MAQAIKGNPKEWQPLANGNPGHIPLVKQRERGHGVMFTTLDLDESEAVTLTAWLVAHGYHRA